MVITFGSRKKNFPAYFLVCGYAFTALIFPDRVQYLAGLGLTLILFLGSYGLGKRLSYAFLKTADQNLYFPIGLGCVLLASYFVFSVATALSFIYAIWGILAVLAVFEYPVLTYRVSRVYLWATPLVLLAFWSTFTPTTASRTLEYYSGLPQFYLSLSKVTVLPHNVFSSFPPFGPTLTLLFSGIHVEAGIRSFSLLIYFQIISVIQSLLKWVITEPAFGSGNGNDPDYQTDLLYMSRMEWLIIPMLLSPAVFLLIHHQTYDLLTSLFFCAAIATLIKEHEVITSLKLWNVGILLAFALWTKYNVLFYIPWILLLLFALNRWNFSRENWKQAGILFASAFLCWIAVPVRNAIALGDPFYPALSGILTVDTWSFPQSLLFERDLMSGGGGILDAVAVFVIMTFRPEGSGLFPLVSIAGTILSRKVKVVSYLLYFVVACYFTWFFLYRDFRQFLPVCLMLYPATYFVFRYIYIRAPKYLWIGWVVCSLVAAVPLLQIFSQEKLILPAQTQDEYLSVNLDYYSIAKSLEQGKSGAVLLLGDTRLAYYRRQLIAGSSYDPVPVIDDLRQSAGVEELLSRFRRKGIRYIVYNERGFDNYYGPEASFRLTAFQCLHLKELFEQHAELRSQKGEVKLFELKGTGE